MKVRVLPGTVLDDNRRKYVPGDELEMDDQEAAARIAAGKVEEVKEAGPPPAATSGKGTGKKARGKASSSPDDLSRLSPEIEAAINETGGNTGAAQ